MKPTDKTEMTKLDASQLVGANFAFQHFPLQYCLATMQEAGLRKIELWGIAPHLDIERVSDAEVSALGRLLGHHELALRSLTPEQVAYPVNIASGDAGLRSASIAHFLRAADIAAALGAEYLFLTPGRGYENAPRDAAWARSVEALSVIVDHARSRGLRCLLEPLQRVESNIVTDLDDLARLWAELPGDSVDLVLDTVAMAAAGDTVEDYIRRFGDRLAHVHLVDGRPAGHLAWGDGELPLGEILQALIRAGYRGTLAFEPLGDAQYAIDPRSVWRRNLTALTPYLDTAGAIA